MKYKNKTIKHRADGRYWARYRIDGIQVSVYGKTEKECYNKLKKSIQTKYKPKKPEPPKEEYTFIGWLDFWYKTFKAPYIKTPMILSHINKHIKPNAPQKTITKLNSLDLQQIINSIPSARTRVDIYQILRACWFSAYKNRIIKEDITLNLVRPPHTKKKGEALTRAEERQFLQDISGTPREKLYIFYLLTGVRRNEALGLNIRDVLWDEKQLLIKGTKTEKSYRQIPLFDSVAELLKTVEPNQDGFYFDFDAQNTTHDFKKYCPNHKLHDLRHTFATRCLENGITMKTVQNWLGHADYATTADIYSRVQTDFEKEQTKTLNNYFDTQFDTRKSNK